jgi:hypothetical protein
MLIITLHNKGINETGFSDYEYKVYINETAIAHGKVIKHRRSDGWQKLVRRMLKEDVKNGRLP